MTSAASQGSLVDRPVALVTGATSGLGTAFARALAERGHDLVLTGRNEARLNELAAGLRQDYGAAVETAPADLSSEAGRDLVAKRAAAGVDVLINNAGFSTSGQFWDADLTVMRAQLGVNVAAVLELTHAALPAMRSVGRGTIINVASISGLISGPASSYTASKAWVVKFSEGLAHKLAGSGIKVQALCPGYMRTEFHERAGGDTSHVPDNLWLDIDEVVQASLADLEKGCVVCIPGRRYQIIELLDRLKPRWLVWRA